MDPRLREDDVGSVLRLEKKHDFYPPLSGKHFATPSHAGTM
jgi:hypothetical protein